jgi:hypothetical protein
MEHQFSHQCSIKDGEEIILHNVDVNFFVVTPEGGGQKSWHGNFLIDSHHHLNINNVFLKEPGKTLILCWDDRILGEIIPMSILPSSDRTLLVQFDGTGPLEIQPSLKK